MIQLQRQQVIMGIVAAVIILVGGAGLWYAQQEREEYPGLTTTFPVDMDEAARVYFTNRLATTRAAIAAQEAAGEEINLNLYLSLASDAFSLGDLVTARQALEKQLQGNSLNYVAWNTYGEVLERMGDFDGAERAYVKAYTSGAGLEEYFRDHVNLLRTHFPDRVNDVRAVLELSVESAGQSSWNMVELGRWYAADGDCERAIAHYEVARTLSPSNAAIEEEMQEARTTCRAQ